MKRCEVEKLAREGSAIYFYTHPDLKALAIGVDDIQDWLENEYTTDDSIQIFYRACEEKQIHLFQIDP